MVEPLRVCDGLTARVFLPFSFFHICHCSSWWCSAHTVVTSFLLSMLLPCVTTAQHVLMVRFCRSQIASSFLFSSFISFFSVRALTKKISHPLPLKKKVVDDILGGAAAWETAERTSSLLSSPFLHLFFHSSHLCSLSPLSPISRPVRKMWWSRGVLHADPDSQCR